MTNRMVRYVALPLCFATLFSCAKSSPTLETEDQKTLYALGLVMGRNVTPFALTPDEMAIVQAGMKDAVTGAKPLVNLEEFGPKISALAEKRASSGSTGSEEAKKKGREFADSVAKESGATTTKSGVVMRTIKPGAGGSPSAQDVVKVHYEGKLIDGKVFDSSIGGEPAEFPLNGVVPCWTEALQKMKKGEKAQVVCPSDVAYGNRGDPPTIPPGATLSFEIELLDFHKP